MTELGDKRHGASRLAGPIRVVNQTSFWLPLSETINTEQSLIVFHNFLLWSKNLAIVFDYSKKIW
jgi:hypothetical protein